MPSTLRVCIEPGCPELTPNRRCTPHQQSYRKNTRSKYDSFYSSKAWRARRLAYLRVHPWCECDDCQNNPAPEFATHVDHITPLTQGGAKFDDNNLQALSAAHHSRKTAHEVWHSDR